MAAATNGSVVKDLPKIADTLKGELLQDHKLSHTATTDRTVLPSATDLKNEKTHECVLLGIEGFSAENLNQVKTREPISPTEAFSQEVARDESLKKLAGFDKEALKHVDVKESNPLPDAQVIEQEANHNKFTSGIENFNKDGLKNVATVEKNCLPSKEEIAQEKK